MICITPLQQIVKNNLNEKEIILGLKKESEPFKLEKVIGHFEFFESGKNAIKTIIEHEKLTREDEVFITTTTDSSYVSTCVTGPIFNYCKLSRVLTDKTKLIFVIHTFNFPHPDILNLRKIANERGIKLVEDCISAFDSYDQFNLRLGSIGDYAVYSLPKIIPVEYGGLLTSKNNVIKGFSDSYLKKKLSEWEDLLPVLTRKRKNNYDFLKNKIGNPIYKDDKNVNPYKFGFLSNQYWQIMSFKNIEFGKTHVRNEVHLPVNPFINLEDYNFFLSEYNFIAI